MTGSRVTEVQISSEKKYNVRLLDSNICAGSRTAGTHAVQRGTKRIPAFRKISSHFQVQSFSDAVNERTSDRNFSVANKAC